MKFSEELGEVLENGGVAVIPTDTIYGLVGSALNEPTINCLYTIKHRDRTKRFTMLVAQAEDIVGLGIDASYIKAFKRYSGEVTKPTSVDMPLSSHAIQYLAADFDSFAVRIPYEFPELISLLEQTGPLASTSANISDHASAQTIEQAQQYFGDSVDVYVDGGALPTKQSALVELRLGRKINIIRE